MKKQTKQTKTSKTQPAPTAKELAEMQAVNTYLQEALAIKAQDFFGN